MGRVILDGRMSGTSTGKYVDKLIEYLQKIDNVNSYIILAKSHRVNEIHLTNKNFKIVECNTKEFSLKEQASLYRQIKSLKPDLVHFPMVQHPIFYTGKKVVGMLDLTALRFRNTSKNLFIFWCKQRIYWIVNYVAAKRANAVITISEYVKKDTISHFGADSNKISVTYNAADKITEPANEINGLAGKEFIMYVGRHQPHKNLNRLVEAHQKLLQKNPELILAIAGKKDSTTEILEKYISGKGYKNIIFAGFVSEGELRWMYENCEAYIFPSLSEGFGLPGLEAMVHGAPVVSSSATCLPEIYGDAAHYFDPLDTEDMVQKIEDVIANEDLRKTLIEKGKAQAAGYSWKKMAEQTLAVYEKVLKS